MMMWGQSCGMGMWMLMGVAALAFWVAIAFGLRSLFPAGKGQQPPRVDPMTLLNESLARAEISIEEYEDRRRILENR
ncbi:SHOCT domain-containing protein [Yimella sp. cx-51]|uniref:SHOCT domain-containing protein n=1 Tax=Yimella sp. cx-51 TaxID=2770551 RepID=UPI001FCBAEFB|nr:SHOCT domain-containing protein [Yimella sp. cx-51]